MKSPDITTVDRYRNLKTVASRPAHKQEEGRSKGETSGKANKKKNPLDLRATV